MKISDSGLFKRKSGTREFRKVYFIAFEGLTELEYFTGIKNNKQRLGISNSIDVQLIERFEQNVGESDPLNILECMHEYRELIRTGIYSTRLFAGTLIEDIFHAISSTFEPKDLSPVQHDLYGLQKAMVNGMNASEDLSKDGFVLDGCWEKATKFCAEIIEAKFPGYEKFVEVPKDRKIDTFDENLDIFCLVVDRDRGSRPSRIYKRILEKRESVNLYVSNPAFEFWLLLHSDYPINMSQDESEKMRSNGKENAFGRQISYAELKLIEVFGEYHKTNIGFEKHYLPKVNKAIENMDSFETDLVGLEHSLGSNVGVLLNRMKGNE